MHPSDECELDGEIEMFDGFYFSVDDQNVDINDFVLVGEMVD